MSIMNCNAFERTFQDAVEKRISIDGEDMRRHADACTRCAGLLVENAVLAEVIPRWNASVPDVDFTDAILARWNENRGQAMSVFARQTDTAAAASAAVSTAARSIGTAVSSSRPAVSYRSRSSVVTLVAAFLFLAAAPFLFVRTATPPIRRVGQQKAGTHEKSTANQRELRSPQKIVLEHSRDSLHHLIGDAGVAYLGLAHNMRETFSGAADLLPMPKFGEGESKGEKTNASPFPPTIPGDWSRDLKPIGRKVEQAFGFLLDAIPRKRPQNL